MVVVERFPLKYSSSPNVLLHGKSAMRILSFALRSSSSRRFSSRQRLSSCEGCRFAGIIAWPLSIYVCLCLCLCFCGFWCVSVRGELPVPVTITSVSWTCMCLYLRSIFFCFLWLQGFFAANHSHFMSSEPSRRRFPLFSLSLSFCSCCPTPPPMVAWTSSEVLIGGWTLHFKWCFDWWVDFALQVMFWLVGGFCIGKCLGVAHELLAAAVSTQDAPLFTKALLLARYIKSYH